MISPLHHNFRYPLTRKFLYSWSTFLSVLTLLVVMGIFGSCRPDDPDSSAANYPEEIEPILNQKCATSGCHNTQSAPGAGGLNLETWATLFEGSRGGSPIVPYAPHLSYLLFSVNTDPDLGSTLSPTMPFNQPALTPQEYAALWNWIYDGAPNAKGEVRFPPNPDRAKWYIGHQICDEVAVFDSETRQIMRYIDVGLDPISVEYTFDIKVSPDGKDWFVVFFGNTEKILRFSTASDEKVAEIDMGHVGFSTLDFSPDGKFAFASSEYLSVIRVIDLEQNKVVGPTTFLDLEARSPAVHPQRKKIYLPQHRGNTLLSLDYDEAGILTKNDSLDLIQGMPPAISTDLLPFEILFLPDGSKYFVSCPGTNEVRVFDGQTDSLLEVITLPASPSRMAYSPTTGRLFVSCMNDLVSWQGDATKRGSIIVIDAISHQLEKAVYSGFQPYAITADDKKGVLVVANRNTDITGPVPHHVSYCEGRNGYVTLIDLNTLEVVPDFKVEILADPSTIAHR